MRTLFIAGLIAIVPGISQGAGRIQVCVKHSGYIPTIVLLKAEAIASEMLATAGVAAEWRTAGRSGCPGLQQALRVDIDFAIATPPGLHAGALAYAYLDRGSEIVVMFDRVEQTTKKSSQLSNLLAHVMTHEITHILQGTARHSETGVMKAHWVSRDFDLMEYHPLPFTPEDIELIRMGLARRTGSFQATAALADARKGSHL